MFTRTQVAELFGRAISGEVARLASGLPAPAIQGSDPRWEPTLELRSGPSPTLSQPPVTLGAVSNKRSDYGSLADRTGGRSEPGRSPTDRPLPAGIHVWVRTDAADVAGLLAGWRRQTDGAWWGRVILVTDGQPSETLIRADLLRKAA